MCVCVWWVGVLQPHVCDNVKYDINTVNIAETHKVKTERPFLISIRRWTEQSYTGQHLQIWAFAGEALDFIHNFDSFLAIWPKSNKMRRETLDNESRM